jgi:hypothetical protein
MNRNLAAVFISVLLIWTFPAACQDFRFDSSMSRVVLENYLSRSISFTELLHDDLTKARNSRGVDPRVLLPFHSSGYGSQR